MDKLLKILQHPEEKERIQAIYELQSAVKVDPELHWEIMQALATFIRTNSPHDKQGEIESDIQEALEVIGKRNIDLDSPVSSIDLAQTNLAGANLKGANLIRANLKGANLAGAYLLKTNLEGAYLSKANLEGANLERANLEGTKLQRANLERANLMEVENLTTEQLSSAKNWGQALNISDNINPIPF